MAEPGKTMTPKAEGSSGTGAVAGFSRMPSSEGRERDTRRKPVNSMAAPRPTVPS